MYYINFCEIVAGRCVCCGLGSWVREKQGTV